MNDFKKRGGFGGKRDGDRRGGFGRPKFEGGGRRFGRTPAGAGSFGRETELFPATCADCGKQCEVPFKPNGKKPVLCKNCFGGGEGSPTSRPAFRSAPRAGASTGGSDDLKERIDGMNRKLDAIYDLLTHKG